MVWIVCCMRHWINFPQVVVVYSGSLEPFEDFAWFCCRRTNFSIKKYWLLPHNGLHLLWLFGAQFDVDGLVVSSELVENHPLIIPPDAKPPLMFETSMFNSFSKLTLNCYMLGSQKNVLLVPICCYLKEN